ncbi:MAG TPA: hypothetical protein VGN72_16140 [Tepidisphaeraceae bacterium]|nr:hypothetical protein [Tepidisphaeraceae bacterium]
MQRISSFNLRSNVHGTKHPPNTPGRDQGKVGSDPDAAKKVGGKLDFGNAVHRDVVRENEDDPIDRPAGSAPGAGMDPGRRTVGVGSSGAGGDGSSSGGDIDTDFVGVAGGAGLAQSPTDHVTKGPASTDGTSDEFAGGEHAKGDNALPRGQIGGDPMKVRGSTNSPPDAYTGRAGADENTYDEQDTK